MEYRHELVIPNEDLNFRFFVFEGQYGDYHVTKHWHRHIEIFAVYEGEIDYYINDKKHHLKSGDFVLLNTNEIHSIDVPNKNYTLVMQIPLESFEGYLGEDKIIFFSHDVKTHDKEIMDCLLNMHKIYVQKKYGYKLEMQSYFYNLLYILVSKYQVKKLDKQMLKNNKQLNKLSNVTNYIREHYNEKLTLESVAKTFAYSKEYLSRMFKKYGKMNYRDFVTEIRLEKAYKELMNTNKSISKIAVDNGFVNGRAFSKAFHKKYGTTPSKYKMSKK